MNFYFKQGLYFIPKKDNDLIRRAFETGEQNNQAVLEWNSRLGRSKVDIFEPTGISPF
jgi:hypothetical protein